MRRSGRGEVIESDAGDADAAVEQLNDVLADVAGRFALWPETPEHRGAA
jgi:hypothetical protein